MVGNGKLIGPIVFFGSGPVAAKSLALLNQIAEIELVITKKTQAHHKGSIPVLEIANELSLKVIEVNDKASLDETITTSQINSKLAVLIDFGIIVSQKVIDYFPLGIINSHFSLLPQWRGADPITFAILSGQEKTGVSLMLLVEKMDEGPILSQKAIELSAEITEPALTDELIRLSHSLLEETLPRYIAGAVKPIPQNADPAQISYSRKITKDDGQINWTLPAGAIERQIRAYISWPKSHAKFEAVEAIITEATADDKDDGVEVGTVSKTDTTLSVRCHKGWLTINRLKPVGKQEMSTAEFLRGYGSRIGSKVQF